MKQALCLTAGVAVLLWVSRVGLGPGAAARAGYTAMTPLAAAIAATFLWLWRERATPLALGMAFSWAGAAGLCLWWARVGAAPGPLPGQAVPPAVFACLALYLTGALLHFAVIRSSLPSGAARGLVWGTAAATAAVLVPLLR
ncbi:hypothetical protein EKE94_00780 [Mesobaculum littorinae]|uniref:Uncharacterized protein n=1 Tax=Mesobaculum littorinae TaxID=2486419 RepID=A0A438AKY9_9RHOB|nr:hypothetical protein [Mesobaculum littorinae]RVV99266.1 hypothetical protein EKE94_00780 [Mesobaculum littorinae]